eukprot:3999113-Amphidinium_carterae.2
MSRPTGPLSACDGLDAAAVAKVSHSVQLAKLAAACCADLTIAGCSATFHDGALRELWRANAFYTGLLQL